jgi:hypothetical protein
MMLHVYRYCFRDGAIVGIVAHVVHRYKDTASVMRKSALPVLPRDTYTW